MLAEMMNYYNICPDFKQFVDRYRTKHRTTVETALKHKLVQETYKYYLSEKRATI